MPHPTKRTSNAGTKAKGIITIRLGTNLSKNVGGCWAWNVSTKTGADIIAPTIRPRNPAATLSTQNLRRPFVMVLDSNYETLEL